MLEKHSKNDKILQAHGCLKNSAVEGWQMLVIACLYENLCGGKHYITINNNFVCRLLGICLMLKTTLKNKY